MNDFKLALLPSAEDDLADIWLRSMDRTAVSRADATADRMLRRDPLGAGTLVAEELYRLTIPPLVYYFTLDLVERRVEVTVIREVRP